MKQKSLFPKKVIEEKGRIPTLRSDPTPEDLERAALYNAPHVGTREQRKRTLISLGITPEDTDKQYIDEIKALRKTHTTKVQATRILNPRPADLKAAAEYTKAQRDYQGPTPEVDTQA